MWIISRARKFENKHKPTELCMLRLQVAVFTPAFPLTTVAVNVQFYCTFNDTSQLLGWSLALCDISDNHITKPLIAA